MFALPEQRNLFWVKGQF